MGNFVEGRQVRVTLCLRNRTIERKCSSSLENVLEGRNGVEAERVFICWRSGRRAWDLKIKERQEGTNPPS